jgi:hypothetical protein
LNVDLEKKFLAVSIKRFKHLHSELLAYRLTLERLQEKGMIPPLLVEKMVESYRQSPEARKIVDDTYDPVLAESSKLIDEAALERIVQRLIRQYDSKSPIH